MSSLCILSAWSNLHVFPGSDEPCRPSVRLVRCRVMHGRRLSKADDLQSWSLGPTHASDAPSGDAGHMIFWWLHAVYQSKSMATTQDYCMNVRMAFMAWDNNVDCRSSV